MAVTDSTNDTFFEVVIANIITRIDERAGVIPDSSSTGPETHAAEPPCPPRSFPNSPPVDGEHINNNSTYSMCIIA